MFKLHHTKKKRGAESLRGWCTGSGESEEVKGRGPGSMFALLGLLVGAMRRPRAGAPRPPVRRRRAGTLRPLGRMCPVKEERNKNGGQEDG